MRRAKEPAKGTLDLPGGFVDMYETVEDGMRREIKEETGLDVTEIQYLFSSPNVYVQYTNTTAIIAAIWIMIVYALVASLTV